MAKKATKKNKTVRQGDKCAFVRGLPRSLPAAEVQERALKKGMVMSIAYIHNIRSAAGKSSRELLKKKKSQVMKWSNTTKERCFKELVIVLGPARSKKLLQQCETALSHR